MSSAVELRLGASYWIDQFDGTAPRHPGAERQASCRRRGYRRWHHWMSGGARAGERRILGADSRGESSRPWQHGGKHRVVDAGARRGLPRSGCSLWNRARERDLDAERQVGPGLVAMIRGLRINAGLQEVRSGVLDVPHRSRQRSSTRTTPPSFGWNRGSLVGVGCVAATNRDRGRWWDSDQRQRPGRSVSRMSWNCGASQGRRRDDLRANSVRRIRGTPRGVRRDLYRGEVTSEWAVIATGYATPEFKPLAGRFRMSSTYVIATAPVDRGSHRRMGRDVIWWDTERPYHYARWTPDRRLLFGGRDIPQVAEGSRAAVLSQQAARLRGDLVRLYPMLEPTAIDYAWDGLFATTKDGLVPRHPSSLRKAVLCPRIRWNGMTFGFLAAQ